MIALYLHFVAFYHLKIFFCFHTQHHAGDRGGKQGTGAILAPSLQHQTSTEDIENPSTQFINVQLK